MEVSPFHPNFTRPDSHGVRLQTSVKTENFSSFGKEILLFVINQKTHEDIKDLDLKPETPSLTDEVLLSPEPSQSK